MARRALLSSAAWIALLVAGCSNAPLPAAHDAGLEACIDRPGLDRAPTGQLPCDLLPPGFTH